MTYDEGKVYLQDIRNGTIYPYERFLAEDRNFKPCIPNPVKTVYMQPPSVDSSHTTDKVQDGTVHEPLTDQL